MRMDDMVVYLEKNGFEAEKKYISDERVYDFAISLPGRPTVHSKFKYPENCDPGVKDDIQREFLDELMVEYDRHFRFLGQTACVKLTNADGDYTAQLKMYQNMLDQYIRKDAEATMGIYNKMSLTIKDVIFNEPATIVFWMDGTKTVVKCQEGDIYDPEKGLAMAISKKALGNKGNYCNELKKWLPKEKEASIDTVIGRVASFEQDETGIVARICMNATMAAEKLRESLNKTQSLSLHFDDKLGEKNG